MYFTIPGRISGKITIFQTNPAKNFERTQYRNSGRKPGKNIEEIPGKAQEEF